MTNLLKTLAIASLVLLAACAPSSKSESSGSSNSQAKFRQHILFLQFDLTRDSSANIRIGLAQQLLAPGKLKSRDSKVNQLLAGHLIIEILDHVGGLITSLQVENPLEQTIEYPKDNGQFGRTETKRDSATLPVRFNYTKKMSRVRVYAINAKKRLSRPYEFALDQF